MALLREATKVLSSTLSWRCVCHGLSQNSPSIASDDGLGSGHQSPGLWRHPEDKSWRFNDIEHWTDLAKLLEKGKLHGIFIADVLGKL